MKRPPLYLLSLFILAGCAGPYPGPDKQFSRSLSGAAAGAGAGAVTGFQVGAGTGPGAAVGAGFGAVAGGIHGLMTDNIEEDLLAMSAAAREERERAYAHDVLADHYRRRMELHPTRDIYPADLFFYGDEVDLTPAAVPVVREIARMNKRSRSWSRMVVASYVKSRDKNSTFARHLARERSKAIGDYLVREGIEPRRIETRAIVIEAPILIDPADTRDRYSQAIELIPVDR